MKVFISGSRSLKEIPEAARDLIDQHLHCNRAHNSPRSEAERECGA